LWLSIRFSAKSRLFGDISVPGQDRMDNLVKVHSQSEDLPLDPRFREDDNRGARPRSSPRKRGSRGGEPGSWGRACCVQVESGIMLQVFDGASFIAKKPVPTFSRDAPSGSFAAWMPRRCRSLESRSSLGLLVVSSTSPLKIELAPAIKQRAWRWRKDRRNLPPIFCAIISVQWSA